MSFPQCRRVKRDGNQNFMSCIQLLWVFLNVSHTLHVVVSDWVELDSSKCAWAIIFVTIHNPKSMRPVRMKWLKRKIMVHIPKYKTFKNEVVKDYIVTLIFFNYVILVKKSKAYMFPLQEKMDSKIFVYYNLDSEDLLMAARSHVWLFLRYFKRSAHVRPTLLDCRRAVRLMVCWGYWKRSALWVIVNVYDLRISIIPWGIQYLYKSHPLRVFTSYTWY